MKCNDFSRIFMKFHEFSWIWRDLGGWGWEDGRMGIGGWGSADGNGRMGGWEDGRMPRPWHVKIGHVKIWHVKISHVKMWRVKVGRGEIRHVKLYRALAQLGYR